MTNELKELKEKYKELGEKIEQIEQKEEDKKLLVVTCDEENFNTLLECDQANFNINEHKAFGIYKSDESPDVFIEFSNKIIELYSDSGKWKTEDGTELTGYLSYFPDEE